MKERQVKRLYEINFFSVFLLRGFSCRFGLVVAKIITTFAHTQNCSKNQYKVENVTNFVVNLEEFEMSFGIFFKAKR